VLGMLWSSAVPQFPSCRVRVLARRPTAQRLTFLWKDTQEAGAGAFLLFLLQATIRIQSAWYKVSIDPPDLWLTLVGNCGGEPLPTSDLYSVSILKTLCKQLSARTLRNTGNHSVWMCWRHCHSASATRVLAQLTNARHHWHA
jgi:hypothetical protein